MPKTTAPKKKPDAAAVREAAAKRQKDYVERLKKAGYVALSGLYVPKVIRDECREIVKARVAAWEAHQKF